MLIYGIKMI
jgi:hypothetical protein